MAKRRKKAKAKKSKRAKRASPARKKKKMKKTARRSKARKTKTRKRTVAKKPPVTAPATSAPPTPERRPPQCVLSGEVGAEKTEAHQGRLLTRWRPLQILGVIACSLGAPAGGRYAAAHEKTAAYRFIRAGALRPERQEHGCLRTMPAIIRRHALLAYRPCKGVAEWPGHDMRARSMGFRDLAYPGRRLVDLPRLHQKVDPNSMPSTRLMGPKGRNSFRFLRTNDKGGRDAGNL